MLLFLRLTQLVKAAVVLLSLPSLFKFYVDLPILCRLSWPCVFLVALVGFVLPADSRPAGTDTPVITITEDLSTPPDEDEDVLSYFGVKPCEASSQG